MDLIVGVDAECVLVSQVELLLVLETIVSSKLDFFAIQAERDVAIVSLA